MIAFVATLWNIYIKYDKLFKMTLVDLSSYSKHCVLAFCYRKDIYLDWCWILPLDGVDVFPLSWINIDIAALLISPNNIYY